jgi:hypothetical protein
MRLSRSTVLTLVVVGLLAAALVPSTWEAWETGRIYTFSWQFLEDIPRRLTGPGRLRFVLQPTVATILGIRGGVADARAGRPAYLFGLLTHRALRREYLASAWNAVRDLVAIAIILDVIAQYLIFRSVHPGAALLLGPVLISAPYSLARGLANRVTRARTASPAKLSGRQPRPRQRWASGARFAG